MQQRARRWVIGVVLALAFGLANAYSQPSIAYGADSTPTPVQVQTSANPGGSTGGGG